MAQYVISVLTETGDFATAEEDAAIDVFNSQLQAQGQWVFERVWNGDQTDYGLNFTSAPQLLRVKLATYR